MENKAETTYYVSNKSSNHSAEQQSVGNHDSGLIGMKKSAEIFDEVSNIENSDKRENIKTDIIHDNERSDASRKDQLINECSESATSTRCDRIFWRNMGEISRFKSGQPICIIALFCNGILKLILLSSNSRYVIDR